METVGDVLVHPFLFVLFEGPEGVVERPARALTEHPLAIGRACEGLVLGDPRTSRQHALARIVGDEVELEDTSSNGTFVNGRRVEGRRVLRDGDIFRCGDCFLLLRYLDEPFRASPDGLMTGRSAAMGRVLTEIKRLAKGDAIVLIEGEEGTGKEEAARELHVERGLPGPFIAVHCKALSRRHALLRLFGGVDPAGRRHRGFLEEAEGGTLFLDGVEALPLDAQAALAAAVQHGQLHLRQGESESEAAGAPRPVHLICSALEQLGEKVVTGRFDRDLYVAISKQTVRIPPLRERPEDVIPLLCLEVRTATDIEPDLLEALLVHPWRGNVRELLEAGRLMAESAVAGHRLDARTLEARIAKPPKRPERRTLADSPIALERNKRVMED